MHGRPSDCCNGETPCFNCFACRVVEYNEKITSRSPLDTPGTESYYKAVWSALQRKAATMGRSNTEPVAKKNTKKLSWTKKSTGTVSPQQCDYHKGYQACGAILKPGDKVLINALWPVVICEKHPMDSNHRIVKFENLGSDPNSKQWIEGVVTP